MNTRPAIKRIGKGNGSPKLTPAQERARRSVSEFRKLLPTLTAYARNLTGKKDVKVVMDAHSNGHTDGKSIFVRPPLALGDLESMRHDKSVCDKRDPQTLAQLCLACEVRESILSTVYHEIAHIAFDTFLAVGNDDIEGAIEMIRQYAPTWYYEAVKKRLAVAKYRMQVNEFLKLAMVVNPYLKTLVNGLEDSRINERMAQARPGTRIMQQAKTYKVAYGGVEQKNPRTGEAEHVKWQDYDLNMQASIGLHCAASGYNIEGWFSERVEGALTDEQIQNLCKDVPALPTAKQVFGRSFEIFLRMRELGFFVTKDEELPPPPEEEESDDEDVERESSDADDSESGSEDEQHQSDGNDSSSDDRDDSEGEREESTEGSPSDSGGASGREDTDSDGGDEGDRRPDGAGDSEADDNAGGEPAESDSDDTESDTSTGERPPSAGEDDGDSGDRGGDDPDEHSEADSRGEDQSPAGDSGDPEGSDGRVEEEGTEASDHDGGSGDSDSGDAEAGPSSSDGEAGEPGKAGTQPGSSGSDGPDQDGSVELGNDDSVPEGDGGADKSDASWDGSGDGDHYGDRPEDGEGPRDDSVDSGDSESAGQASGDGGEAGDGPSDSEVDAESAEQPEPVGGSGRGEGAPEGGSGSESGGPREGEGTSEHDDSGADDQGHGEATGDSDLNRDPLGTGTDSDSLESEGGSERSGEVREGSDAGADQAGGSESGSGGEDGSEEYVDPLDYRPDSDQAVDATNGEEREIVPPTIDSDTEIELVDMGLHDEHADPSFTEEAEIESAIVQGLYFEMPSSHVGGLRVWRYADREIDQTNRVWHAWGPGFDGYYGGQSKADINPVGEQHLGPALMKLRVAFSDNRRTRRNRNQRAGRIDTRALGKRAWGNDDRLFGRKIIPGKKDYFVVIGLDVSGSTRGINLKMIKEAALAQAELCQRLGVKFAVYAHTGSPVDADRLDSRYVDIYEVKSPEQAWDATTRAALMEIGPSAANLDGHTLEFYRKVCDGEKATNKVILYYSDGAMPLENYHEELEILQREIANCRQKKITLLGVGVRTDSPTKHGLDTVQIDDSTEVGKVVAHLERALIP